MDTSPSTSKSVGIVVAVMVGGGILALALFFSQTQQQVGPTDLRAALPNEQPEKVAVVMNENDPSIGAATAPVTIVLFSDWQCPHCTQWHREVLPELTRQYLDTNRARLVFKDFTLSQIHPQAQAAAEAAQCAAVQNKFWEYAALVAQPGAGLDNSTLRALATQLQLDTATFEQCTMKHEQAATVASNVQAGIAAGVTSTPTFIINGVLLEGVQSVAVLGAAITAASR